MLWKDLQACQKPIPSTKDKDFDMFLLTLFFLKVYPTEEVIALCFSVHEQTARKWIVFYITKISNLVITKIVWPSDWGGLTYIISVDGVNFGTNEQRHPFLHKIKKYFDQKGGKAGQTYEIVLHLWKSQIVWVSGRHPPNDGGDRTIFMGSGEAFKDGKACLNDTITAGKKAIADKIYTGLERVALHNSLNVEEVRVCKKEQCLDKKASMQDSRILVQPGIAFVTGLSTMRLLSMPSL